MEIIFILGIIFIGIFIPYMISAIIICLIQTKSIKSKTIKILIIIIILVCVCTILNKISKVS